MASLQVCGRSIKTKIPVDTTFPLCSHTMTRLCLSVSLLLIVVALLCHAGDYQICEQLLNEIPPEMDVIFTNYTARWVNPNSGQNTPACLNSSSAATPCSSLKFALLGQEDTNQSSDVHNLVVYLSPGMYSLSGGLPLVNAHRVAIIGNSSTVSCGVFGKENDRPCSYMNFQIRNSTYVYVSGITFTQCGPVTSNVYVADSSYVFFKDCVFCDNLSPPFLIFNTHLLMLDNLEFTNNWPQNLSSEIARNPCYFSGRQDLFFLDNRTTSGGFSFFIEDKQLSFLITNCTFRNNSARPDVDVSLPRNSDGYGHGGAANIRLVNSSDSRVCILESVFEDNFAQAHSGGLAIALAGGSSQNRFAVVNTTFNNNWCQVDKCTAGAVGIDFYTNTLNNQVLLLNINFNNNTADTGGAVSLTTAVSAKQNSEGESDKLVLTECMFESNKAFFEGTALGAFSLTHGDQIGVPVEVVNCHFHNNQGRRGSADTTSVTTYRVLITFKGYNSFVSNSGGGITLLGSRMDVNGSVVFDGNRAVFGGGLAMAGRSLLLLYSGAHVSFMNNYVTELGAGMYVEYTSSDFVLSVLNRGCFIQYYNASVIDTPPMYWNAHVEFMNNTAGLAGAALYANDMSRCKWLGGVSSNSAVTSNPTIFENSTDPSPFYMSNNTVLSTTTGTVTNNDLATDPSNFSATTEFNTINSSASYGEKVSLRLSSHDQFRNFREAVWSVNAPLETQTLGSLSSRGSTFVYDVPSREQLEGLQEVMFINDTTNITAEFSLLQSEAEPSIVTIPVGDCHPGYKFDNVTQQCVCQDQLNEIVRCDASNRYFYVREGFWVGVEEGSNKPYFSTTPPGFLNCTSQGFLPGCLFQYDHSNRQCASGRHGTLCGECQKNYGVTFDLRFCRDCGAGGPVLFAVICLVTLVLSLLVLYFDFPLPNELKGVIFFAQVIGLIYRNTPYLSGITQQNQSMATTESYQFFDFLINMLGFAMPFPVCLGEKVPAFVVAFLGFVPPLITTLTAVLYGCCARYSNVLSQRTHYGFHGFYFLYLFTYKYFVDTSFIFVSCTFLNGESVFIYQGTLKCYESPFVIILVISVIFLVLLGLVLPAYVLYIIYQPKKAIQASNALTYGLKDKRRYRWYSVWDIWRRLLFVAVNVFLGFTTRSVVLFIHCLLILLCLAVLCVVKPYKKFHINVVEALVIIALLGATVSILDEHDVYAGQITSSCFIAFPFLYGAVFIIYRVSRELSVYIWGKANPRWHLRERFAPVSERFHQMHLVKNTTTWLMLGRGMEKEEQGEEDSVTQSGEDETQIDKQLSELREPLLDETVVTPTRTTS